MHSFFYTFVPIGFCIDFMIVAYLRVSTDKQTAQNQRHEIEKFVARKGLNIDQWIEETVSGKKDEADRLLGGLLDGLKKGDILIISELSRLSRSSYGIISILNKCTERKISIISVKEDFELSDNLNSRITSFAFSMVAEVERELISMRTKEALALKKALGIRLGRPPGTKTKMKELDKHKEEILLLRDAGETLEKVAEKYNVSRRTLISYLQQLSSE